MTLHHTHHKNKNKNKNKNKGKAMHPAHPPAGDTTTPSPALIALPDRGIHDTAPADSWTDGFLTGNGEYGAVVYGDPALEKVVLNEHRLVLPNGTRDVTPPVLADRLEAVRDKALAGDHAGASRDFAAGWELRWTQTYHPAYELRIATTDGPAADRCDRDERYTRVTDFRTGEVTSAWTDAHGTWSRRIFVSRADRVVVHELIPAPGRTVDVTLGVHTALDDTATDHGGGDTLHTRMTFTTLADVGEGSGWLNLRATYPEGLGAHGYEGVTRVVPTGGAVDVSGSTVVVTGAARLTLLTRLDRYETPTAWDARPLHAGLAALESDYEVLLARHTEIHSELYDRSRLDLFVPEADRRLSTTELIARQNADLGVIDPALLERLYDSGRYLFLSSSGILPPRLTGIWTGAWTAAWAGDFTTDANATSRSGRQRRRPSTRRRATGSPPWVPGRPAATTGPHRRQEPSAPATSSPLPSTTSPTTAHLDGGDFGRWTRRTGSSTGPEGERPGLLRGAGAPRRTVGTQRHRPHQPAGGGRCHHRLPRHRRLRLARSRRHRTDRHLALRRRRPRGRGRPAEGPQRDRGLLVHRGRRLVHAQGAGDGRGRAGEDHPAAVGNQGRVPDPYHDRALHEVGEPGRGAARRGGVGALSAARGRLPPEERGRTVVGFVGERLWAWISGSSASWRRRSGPVSG
ncbi:hypothetical protein SALBM311S_08928 [Streptomyces alboniger]